MIKNHGLIGIRLVHCNARMAISFDVEVKLGPLGECPTAKIDVEYPVPDHVAEHALHLVMAAPEIAPLDFSQHSVAMGGHAAIEREVRPSDGVGALRILEQPQIHCKTLIEGDRFDTRFEVCVKAAPLAGRAEPDWRTHGGWIGSSVAGYSRDHHGG